MALTVFIIVLTVLQVGKANELVELTETTHDISALGSVQARAGELTDERDELGDMILGTWVAATGIAAFPFIRWFHMAYRSLDDVAPGARRYATGWAIGGWFVPVLALWRPKQLADDIARATGRDAELATLLGWWWSTWVATLVLSGRSFPIGGDEAPGTLRATDIMDAVLSGLSIVAAVVACMMIRRLTDARTGA